MSPGCAGNTNGVSGGGVTGGPSPDRSPGRDAGEPGARSAAIRWKVGAAAGRRAFGVESDRIELEMLVHESESGAWSGTVRVIGGPEPRTVRERPVEVRWQPDDELGLLHIDADGFVRATIDTSNGTPRLLYARSGVLGELGLAGGRYEPGGTELRIGA
jgi:hypothetical protein